MVTSTVVSHGHDYGAGIHYSDVMTGPSSIVQQAVDLLTARFHELQDELTEVSGALLALGYARDDIPIVARDEAQGMRMHAAADRSSLSAPDNYSPRPGVRTAVLGLLESEPSTFHLNDVVTRLRPAYEDHDEHKFRANVRSALYQLKVSGVAVSRGRGIYQAAKWPTDADSPTDAAGLSDGSDQSPEGGEHTDGEDHHHDHRIDFAGRNGDRDHLGAPVGH